MKIILFLLLLTVQTCYAQVHRINRPSRAPLPTRIFSINNIPINICFFKDSSHYVGFILAGHAEKAICQIASLEVSNVIKKIGYGDQTVFTYGVAFDLRPDRWTYDYDTTLRQMKKRFDALSAKHPDQVSVIDIAYQRYKDKLDTIYYNYQKITEAFGKGAKNNRFIVTYNDVKFPVMVPFYLADNVIRFSIPEKDFGAIPTALFFNSIKKDLEKSVPSIGKCIAKNTSTLQKVQNATDNTRNYNFHFYSVSRGKLDSTLFHMGNYPPPPEGYYIETIDETGHRTTRPVTFAEAVAALDDYSVHKTDKVREDLNYYIQMGRAYQREFLENKRQAIAAITENIAVLQNEKKEISSYLAGVLDIDERANKNMSIDAFLRGWPFETFDSVMNSKLDTWYEQRAVVWSKLLGNNPDYRHIINPLFAKEDTTNIAGIFQTENVFFSVKREGEDLVITPYQILGNSFMEVMDKNAPISQFFTLNNFRIFKNPFYEQ